MPAPFLLALPPVHPLVMPVVAALLTAFATWFWTKRAERRAAKAKALEAEEKRLKDVAEAARQAEADKHEWEDYCKRIGELESKSRLFMPENNIRDELQKLGREIADNQTKIKTYHDGNESNYNALNGRVNTLEQHNAALILLPQQVARLNTDQTVLAAEVRALTNTLGDLSKKQDAHFMELMRTVQGMAFTRGELHAGQRRALPPDPYELPPS